MNSPLRDFEREREELVQLLDRLVKPQLQAEIEKGAIVGEPTSEFVVHRSQVGAIDADSK